MTPQPGDFRTTRWTVVLQAAGGDTRGRAALEDLCRGYWYPLYALARRRGLEPSDAEDRVQGFFADLLARGDVARADRERGRFRSFLCGAFRNYQSNQRKHEQALKRGGGERILSLEGAEDRYAAASGRALDPEALFDRAWALATLDEALARLRSDYERRGKGALFEALRPAIVAPEEAQAYAVLAERLDMSAGAVKVAVHRLRGRYREALLAAVGDTVVEQGEGQGEEEVQAELSRLFEALGGG